MSTQTSATGAAGPSQARETAVAPSPRTPRELATLMFAGWPFTDSAWAWPDQTAPAGAPIRVEELVENEQVVVRAELPGVDPEKDIEVTVEDGILTIRAERRETSEDRTARGYHSEFRYGSFVRQVRLPKGTSAEVVSAAYRDGVLEVRMPAPVADRTVRRIDVERA